ncbi:MAG TPA: hypothetical protein VF209_04080 [Patescibacteria group bacterium]
MIILHGENTVQSRAELGKLLDQARQANKTVVRLEAKRLTLADLQEALHSESLFGDEKVIVIEELHSLPTSNRKKELIEALAAADGDHSSSLILWEKRSLTATMLKKLGPAESKEFKLSKALFSWLDSLNGQKRNVSQQLKLFHDALKQEGEYLCFLMLIRQLRMMLQAMDGGVIKGPPFMISKLKNQAQSFSQTQLLSLHQQLLEIDYRQKTSQSSLDLAQELDLLLVNL